MKQLVTFVLERSLLLVAGAVIALVWANLWPESYGSFARATQFAIDDVAMVFFFALATKEIVEATRPGGALASWREAALPLFAAYGGMVVPGLLYVGAALAFGHPELRHGWAIPCATDIAFSYLTARLIFPAGHPAIPFLLLLAVADDALGLIVLAVFYPSGPLAPLWLFVLLGPALAIAWVLRRRRVASFWPYVLLPGGCSWAALYLGGLHPALALVPIVPFMPVRETYHELFDEHTPSADDTLNRFSAWWQTPVQVILFFFGLANAGVPLSSIGPPTWMVAGALLLGKPLGVMLLTVAGVAGGLRRPSGMTYADVVIVGITAGIGFTVALFFATAAFPPSPVLDEAKMGALLSFVAAPLAILSARLVGSRHRTPRPAQP